MKHMFASPALLATVLLAVSPVLPAADPASSAPQPQTTWIYPVITGHGGVHPNDTLPFRPDPAQDYHILVDVITPSKDASKVSGALERLARIVNLMAYAGVPASHVHIVAVLNEGAGLLPLSEAAYQQRFKTGNPNLDLLHQLKQAGVQLLVCSQAMAGAGLTADDMSPDVTVSLSALTDFVVLGHQGYSYLRL